MNPLNPFFALTIYFIAFATSYVLNLKYKFNNSNLRFETMDGMRGFLAIGVFIHHSSIWYQYLHQHYWDDPKSNLFTHFGQTSVAFFFMITSFLFISKLLNAKNNTIDWNTLFISRFFRLVPMYLVSILSLVIIVFIISYWRLNVSFLSLLKELFYWGTFTIVGTPAINGSLYTTIINAGVVWSLPYEWLFYFSLPLISIFIFKRIISKTYFSISILFIVIFYLSKDFNLHHLLSFAGGAISPFIIKYGPKNIKYNSALLSIVIIVSFASIIYFDSSSNYLCKLLIIIVFNLIALGNTVFGILKNPVLKLLGEISFSTYLIHGIILFVLMYFYFGIEDASQLSVSHFCYAIFFITPILVLTSFLTYKYIEKPFMNYSKKIVL